MHSSSLLSGDGLNGSTFVVAGIGFIRLRLSSEQEEYFGPRFHCEMLWKPEVVVQRHLLQFEVCPRLDLGEKTCD